MGFGPFLAIEEWRDVYRRSNRRSFWSRSQFLVKTKKRNFTNSRGHDTLRSKQMAQIPKGSLVTGPYKPICRDCALYILFKYCKWDPFLRDQIWCKYMVTVEGFPLVHEVWHPTWTQKSSKYLLTRCWKPRVRSQVDKVFIPSHESRHRSSQKRYHPSRCLSSPCCSLVRKDLP